MIKITIQPTSIEIEGHAGYAPPGQDIVCAGVSALVQTLIESIQRLTDDPIEYDIGENDVITCVKYRTPSDTTKVLLKSFFIGIDMIVAAYPDYVRIV